MTALSTPDALAILASHGADPARWPETARADLAALARQDADVAAALADAAALDAAITGWLAQPLPLPLPAAAVDVAAITALPQARPQPPRAAWRPALIAASLALVVAVGGWLGVQDRFGGNATTRMAAAPTLSAGAEVAEADAAFAYVFTPTAAEEEVI